MPIDDRKRRFARSHWDRQRDLALVTKLLARDAAATEELYEPIIGVVYSKVKLRFPKQDHLAEEVAHEAAVATLDPDKIVKYRGEGPLRAFLLTTATRAMHDHLRDHIRRFEREVSIEMIEERAAVGTEDGMGFEERVIAAMSQLSEGRQWVLLLNAYGYSYAEIKAFMGDAVGDVGSTLSRARAQMRHLLGPSMKISAEDGNDD